MKDENKTKKQLVEELVELRQRVAEPEASTIKSKRTKELLEESEGHYRMYFNNSPDGLFVVDSKGRYVEVNDAACRMTGYSMEELTSISISDLIAPEQLEKCLKDFEKLSNTGCLDAELLLKRKDVTKFFIQLDAVKLSDDRFIGFTKDITKRKKAEEKLQSLLLTDELTGLYNRRGFFTLAEQQLKIAKRQKSRMFLLYADIDNMKYINDVLGHQKGDLALIEVANILKATYRETDIVARIGGDEFVVFPIGTTEEHVDIITTRLQQNLENHNAKKGHHYRLSISVGIASYDPEAPCSIDELLAKGDTLMYEEKRQEKKS